MPEPTKRDLLVKALAELVAVLAVPVSMPLGPAGQVLLGPAVGPWTEVHTQLVGFGWADAAKYEAAIREVLEG